MDGDLKNYLDARFAEVKTQIRGDAALTRERIDALDARVDSIVADHRTLSGRLWGLAAVALGGLIAGLSSLAGGQKNP